MSEQQSDKMVTIEIDGQTVEAAEGSMVIQAADRLGIAIPRFCYHPKLSIAANCRMCLIDVERAPKPLPACSTPVSHGMKVFTRSRRSLDAQKAVMEFLLINHPLDCPICDQGGECELQDVAMGYGRSVSRFTEQKRAVRDENLGSLVATDMTRCIHCTRCVRFLDEIAGTNELGGIGRGDTMEIKTFIGRTIDSELSGNVIDICPVGALTNKPFRFSARAWELVARPAVSPHDAVGSHLYYHTRGSRIHRAVPRSAESLNESWLADRDRYSHFALDSEQRLLRPQRRVDGRWQEISWTEALQQAGAILSQHKGDQLGVLASPNASMEELYLLQKLARGLGSNHIDHRLRHVDMRDQDTVGLAPRTGARLADVSAADGVLLVGAHPRHDQPILGHRIRQAWRNGAQVSSINCFEHDMHFELSETCIVKPSQLPERLAAVVKALSALSDRSMDPALEKALESIQPDEQCKRLAAWLSEAQRPLLVLGNDAQRHGQAAWLRRLGQTFTDLLGDKARTLLMPDSANGQGAWQVGCLPHRGPGARQIDNPGLDACAMLQQPRQAYLLYNTEPDADHALGMASRAALKQAEQVIAISAFVHDSLLDCCDLLLPLAPMPEASGSMMNAFGDIAHLPASVRPAGEARPGWKILRVLGGQCELDGFEHTDIEQVWQELEEAIACDAQPSAGSVELSWSEALSHQGLERIGSIGIYDADGLTRRAAALQATVLASDDQAQIHPADAERYGWQDGQVALVRQGDLAAEVTLVVSERVPEGAVYLPGGSSTGRRLGALTGEVIIE